jgi:hypothetical protein
MLCLAELAVPVAQLKSVQQGTKKTSPQKIFNLNFQLKNCIFANMFSRDEYI